MPYPGNHDHLLGVIHVIQDAIIAHPQTKPTLRAPKALKSMRPGILC
jgi:hypothetical protein